MPALVVHPPILLVVAATLVGVVAMLTWRSHEARRVVTARSIGALFFLLAFGAIVRWRVAMLREYRRLTDVEMLGSPDSTPA